MNQIEILMKKLDITESEARELIQADEVIDKDTKIKDDSLTKEQKKVVREMSRGITKKKAPVNYKWDTRGKTRKVNTNKVKIIKTLCDAVKEYDEQAKIENADNHITFTYCGEEFSIKLIQHRKGK